MAIGEMSKTSDQMLAQKLRPLLTPDFDQFEDDEFEIIIGIMVDTLSEEARKASKQTSIETNLYIRV